MVFGDNVLCSGSQYVAEHQALVEGVLKTLSRRKFIQKVYAYGTCPEADITILLEDDLESTEFTS